MVIQRLQTVFLLLAVILTAVFCATPFAYLAGVSAENPALAEVLPVYPSSSPAFLVLNIAIAVLLFVTIFLYKNLRLQIKVTLAAIVLLVASAVTCGLIVYNNQPDMSLTFRGGILLLLTAIICTVWARIHMKRDLKLLTSYDRLR